MFSSVGRLSFSEIFSTFSDHVQRARGGRVDGASQPGQEGRLCAAGTTH